MMNVMISIKPKWCERIASGKRTVEPRKTRPDIEPPFKCYIYSTLVRNPIRDSLALTNRWGQGKRVENPCGAIMEGEFFLNGKIIGEFVCDKVDMLFNGSGNPENYMRDILPEILKNTTMSYDEFGVYVWSRGKNKNIHGWHISDLVIYDKPKELSEFRKPLTCHRGIQRDNCDGCWDCEIKIPPQSWCYCEVSEND